MVLLPRDNQGYSISPALIIFLVILGSGFLVCCGFAIFRFYGADENQGDKTSPEQEAYMRKVRERTLKSLSKISMQSQRIYPKRNLNHTPLSHSENSNTTYG
ncbi:hypothetical protein GQ44DRAFT_699035 [Phaeosphaeriaceae sp. PMI808]|nr:hypothetical protein GQ44DRAFT_699035 [Phaeosphaeriaceae sp. PMI808]